MEKALKINALFSGVSGLTLVLFHQSIATLFDVELNSPFWMIGIGLIIFAGSILFEIRRQNTLGVLWIIIQDMVWVVASIYLLVANPFSISMIGNLTIALVAAIVLVLAINQASALSRVDTVNSKGEKQFYFKRVVASTKTETWKVVSDVSNYHKVAPNIDAVKIVSGSGEGMVRICSHGKGSWSETCSVWNEEKTYSFIVNTTAPDYPYPFKFLRGTWLLEPVDDSHTAIIMVFDFAYQKKIQNLLLHPIARPKFKKTAEELLNNWQTMLEKKDSQTAV
jgi:ribosome-associated toxin RatA of RatAB toxin-antitoxin module